MWTLLLSTLFLSHADRGIRTRVAGTRADPASQSATLPPRKPVPGGSGPFREPLSATSSQIVLSPYTAALFVAVTNADSEVMVAVDDDVVVVVVVAATAIVLLGIY